METGRVRRGAERVSTAPRTEPPTVPQIGPPRVRAGFSRCPPPASWPGRSGHTHRMTDRVEGIGWELVDRDRYMLGADGRQVAQTSRPALIASMLRLLEVPKGCVLEI
jgi:hypothetical protein